MKSTLNQLFAVPVCNVMRVVKISKRINGHLFVMDTVVSLESASHTHKQKTCFKFDWIMTQRRSTISDGNWGADSPSRVIVWKPLSHTLTLLALASCNRWSCIFRFPNYKQKASVVSVVHLAYKIDWLWNISPGVKSTGDKVRRKWQMFLRFGLIPLLRAACELCISRWSWYVTPEIQENKRNRFKGQSWSKAAIALVLLVHVQKRREYLNLASVQK